MHKIKDVDLIPQVFFNQVGRDGDMQILYVALEMEVSKCCCSFAIYVHTIVMVQIGPDSNDRSAPSSCFALLIGHISVASLVLCFSAKRREGTGSNGSVCAGRGRVVSMELEEGFCSFVAVRALYILEASRQKRPPPFASSALCVFSAGGVVLFISKLRYRYGNKGGFVR